MKKTKNLIIAIVLSLVLLAGITTPIVLTLMPKSNGFTTSNITANSVTVPDIVDKNGAVNKTNWETLLLYLSGTTNLSNVTTATQTATDIRRYTYNSKTNAQSLLVTIGGVKWIAVYLSTQTISGNQNKILTLWQADTYTSIITGASTAMVKSALWNDGSATSDGNFPSDMYGVSKIRSVTLSNGGLYWTSTSALNVNDPGKEGAYKPFTNGIYTKYLVTPNQISWQNGTIKQSAKSQFNWNNDLNNENCSTDISDLSFGSSGSYADKLGYTNWGEDYVWLPSITETGSSDSVVGIWETNSYERSTSGDINSACWLRSGNSGRGAAYNLNPDGTGSVSYTVNNSRPVRPALHVNLNMISSYWAPVITTAVYMNGAGTVTGAGTYDYGTTQTLTAIANDGFEFYGWVINDDFYNTNLNNPVSFVLTESVKYTAIFQRKSGGASISNSLYVGLECSNESNLACVGTVATNGYTNLDTNDMEVHITATPSRGYRFVGWKIDGELSSKYTESATDVLLSDVPNGMIVAYFEKITNT